MSDEPYTFSIPCTRAPIRSLVSFRDNNGIWEQVDQTLDSTTGLPIGEPTVTAVCKTEDLQG